MSVWQPLIVCAQFDNEGKAHGFDHMCQFSDMMLLVKNLISDLVIVATLATTAVLVFAGIKLLTASFEGNAGALKQVQGMFTSVIKGYVFILAAWIIVYTILTALVNSKFILLK